MDDLELETNYNIYHKIEAGKKIRVFKSTFNDRNYYKVQVTQKNYQGDPDKFYIALQFKKGVELADPDGKGIDIIIHSAYENFRKNPKDEYNPILYYVVTDFEQVKRQEQLEEEAYADFQDNLNEVEVSEADLPFW